MTNATLEQLIEAARALPPDERRRLREWLEEQEREIAREQQKSEELQREQERFQKSLAWVKEHTGEYLGQWVVLDGDRLISHGTDGGLVYDEAKAAGIETPFLLHVVEEEGPFYAGW
ncbi:MAG: DUF5678 domain-containing protein [Blastocatellia bacterium]|nr:DUF5678 domain-containing protein [Blastocatellia bacterium]